MSASETTLGFEASEARTEIPLWWRDGFALFNGVFEGGGAKGLAYVGALRALHDNRIWFHRVAGASVGSMIAALVASGLSVEAFADALDDIRHKFPAFGLFKTLRQLRSRAGILDPAELHTYLTDLLARQVEFHQKKPRSDPTVPVNFEELFDATGIELNVLAVDIFDRREVVFNSFLTPRCQVVDAVLASSAIPGVFPPGRLCIRNNSDVTLTHPIVDGGVWANFPMFVFTDDRFRDFHRLPELADRDDRRVIGFLLEESQLISTQQRRARFATPLADSRFWSPGDAFVPAEMRVILDDPSLSELASGYAEMKNDPRKRIDYGFWKGGPEAELLRRLSRTSFWQINLVRMLLPFATAYDLVVSQWKKRSGESAVWPTSAEFGYVSILPRHRNRLVRWFQSSAEMFRSVFGLLFILGALALLVTGAIVGIETIKASGWLEGLGIDWYSAALILPALGYLAFFVIVLIVIGLALVAVAALGTANYYGGRFAGRYGYLLGSTMMAAGSVRYWMDSTKRDAEADYPVVNVIRVPVPSGLSTLSFEYVPINFAIELARVTVEEQLTALGLSSVGDGVRRY